MEAMSLFVPLCHDLMIVSITLQLMLIALLLLYKMWRAFLHWRKGVVFSSTLVPTLDQLVPLPHPNPVLLWAVEWDSDIRTMVEDLKNEGPSAVERYCQNEAFILKLRKILRNVVSKNDMRRITEEVMMKEEVAKFHTTCQKSAEEEDEDFRAWQAMMQAIDGQGPNGTQPTEANVGAVPAAQQWQQKTAAALEEDDAEALQEMLAVMNRKPGDTGNGAQAATVLPVPAAPTREPNIPASELEEEDARALQEMLAEVNGEPTPAQVPPVAMSQPAIPESELEEEDAKALQEMLAVMNRKPFEANGATAPVRPVTPVPPVPPVPTTESVNAASILEDDEKALQEMMAVMSRKPCEAKNVPEPEPMLSEPASAASAFDGGDAKALQDMMSVMSRNPLEVQEEALSEQSDDTADLWAQMEELEDQGATLEEQARKFVSLCMPKGKLSSRDEKKTTTHFFIGESFDAEEEQEFDSFWLALDEDLCNGAEMMPQVQKLLDCFAKPKGAKNPKGPPMSAQCSHFYIGDEVEVTEVTEVFNSTQEQDQQGTVQQFYIGDEDVPEMSLP